MEFGTCLRILYLAINLAAAADADDQDDQVLVRKRVYDPVISGSKTPKNAVFAFEGLSNAGIRKKLCADLFEDAVGDLAAESFEIFLDAFFCAYLPPDSRQNHHRKRKGGKGKSLPPAKTE